MPVTINKGNRSGTLDMTPMIDIVFQLLIFFLVATKLEESERELHVVLPSASEAKPITAKPKEVIVNIDKDGNYFADGRPQSAQELETLLNLANTNNPGKQSVIIRADKRCTWDYVVAVMNLCNKAKIMDYRVTTAEGG